MQRFKSFCVPFLFLLSSSAWALPEAHVLSSLNSVLIPFLQAGTEFKFPAHDGLALSAIKWVHPQSLATLVVVQGRSESWAKYAEIFYDLYQQGYSIYAYDHRGQGKSPHLSSVNSQIGEVKKFAHYTADLNAFVEMVVKPEVKTGPLFLISHSMGGQWRWII